MNSRFLVLIAAVIALFAPCASFADSRTYTVNSVIGSGPDGKLRGMWRQEIPDSPIDTVEIVFRPVSRNPNMSLELRFGSDHFDTKHRFAVSGSARQTAQWRAPAQSSTSLLTLVALGGEVEIEAVTVYFRGNPAETGPAEMPRPSDIGRDLFQPEQKTADEFEASEDGKSARGLRNPYAQDLCTSAPDYKPPVIAIDVVQLDYIRGQLRVKGAITGTCMEQAGYYEFNVPKKMLHIVKSSRKRTENFNLFVRGGREGEIRVHTSDGKTTTLKVDQQLPKVVLPRL